MDKYPTIEVFQDLLVTDNDRLSLRKALLDAVAAPWHHDTEVEERLLSMGTGDEERMLAFTRAASKDIAAATVTLFPDGASSYKVSNIVPRERSSLSEGEYNAVLLDLVTEVVEKAKQSNGITFELSTGQQGPLDWTTQEAANALLTFSLGANKSSAASHQLDRERWMAFIVAAHRSEHEHFYPSYLARWLTKAEHWPEDVAERLATDYESSLELLAYYDENRE
ncbi:MULTISPECIES: hypothetical protein [unclassified Caballeronia]|uniref:hypothetical protein n=1 Tax=unclassified Caballeronia TaxID=2646786 RepID=UPI0028673E4C|nr:MULTISPECIES: hypothetical protein [unclassified Caballeronia]MDR5776849.1 hypothetical protein [Caballeronia sp. LZ002]MDR5798845.1 hypothetical protein [Caballeronia sp. LZ001]MDR5852366.1 hypothetical protein [Caballeronia sp. LZ003]